jgi:hypothetical protein
MTVTLMSKEHQLAVDVDGPAVVVTEAADGRFVYSMDDDEEVFAGPITRWLGQEAIIGAVRLARNPEARAVLMSCATTIRIMREARI